MASCTQIANILQAYLDGEVNHSDKVILEEHVAECPECSRLLRKHQRMSAEMFEAFSDYRLRRQLRGSILENLPVMEGGRLERSEVDLAGLNWRAKHPRSTWGKITRRVPVIAAFVLLGLAVVLKYNWPAQTSWSEPIGVVTQASGTALQTARDATERMPAELRDFVQAGERYETGDGSTLMLSLLGPTQVKLRENTRLTIIDERRLRVEEGEAWVDVGSDGRLFRVATPSGKITVLGTAFSVKVDTAKDATTTVAVQRGQVQVEGDRSFELVRAGHQVRVIEREPATPVAIDVDAAVAWADAILEDRSAKELFQEEVLARSEVTELRGKFGAVIDTTEAGGGSRAVSAIILRWTPDGGSAPHAGYDVYVYDTQMGRLAQHHVPGKVFDDPDTSSYKIPITSGAITGTKLIFISLVPVHEDGTVEMAIESINAVAS